MERWNTKGFRDIKLDSSRVWRLDGNEVYGDEFRLGWEPRPDHAATVALLESLSRAGFKAKTVSESRANVEWQHDGDGMGPVVVEGFHDEWFLVIDWQDEGE